ncbi:GNAT family N-acetyltransferase [Erwinia tasmaniensis]|uniref:GCN5-related N-acetyltransferase n=1 Tax=Erwinia tasmaniensis (strain DSM 17950 / CFBP 7177 / CIP 109463 / NCPPB 4357 / Et1/99) TaxID=465817 RepID=B2VFJ2_ERWT9|nr:GNAT family N-acetyltransferase [Erwinia tasmaniensis]CAO96431.1 GCN5-related N-acetyltransferase [Erwinia tasmaniensis Et1/99]
MTIELVNLNESHLDGAFVLTQKLQWPHRRVDWQQMLMLGSGLVALENGAPVGTTLCWRWGHDYATLGLVIVDESCQGRGIGRLLLQATLGSLGDRRVRLHATPAGRPLYEKLGFIASGHVLQHESSALGAVAAIPCSSRQQLRHATPEDAALLAALDHQALGQERTPLIDQLLSSAQRVLILEEDGRAGGFAGLRRFGHGYAIGPVVAAGRGQARLLIARLLSGLEGQFVRVDSNGTAGLDRWLSELGMMQVDAPITMYKGQPWRPQAGGMQTFGLMSQAMA